MANFVWGWNPATASVFLQGLLLVGVIIAIFQLIIARRAARLNLMFKLLETYDDSETYKGLTSLSGKSYKTLTEFNTAFANGSNEDAHVARRKLKLLLASYGYLLKKKLASPEDIFPLVPAAINLWGDGLGAVEKELLIKTKRVRENELGYDPVALADHLYIVWYDRVYGNGKRSVT